MRVAAALYHTFLVPILEIAPLGDNLLMVMDVVEGQPISRKRRTAQPLDRAEFFRIAYQLASRREVPAHRRTSCTATSTGDAVLVTPDGQVKLGGPEHRQPPAARAHVDARISRRGATRAAVAYIAPEQIASQTLDEHTDIFSIGVGLLRDGHRQAAVPRRDRARTSRARSSKGSRSRRAPRIPNIDNAVMSVLGACLFKDPFKRAKDVKALVESIEKLDPRRGRSSRSSSRRRSRRRRGAPCEQRRSILFVADVANYDALAAEDPERAAKAAARMQQILGESVYLFDGQVVDPFGTRMVAELPTVEARSKRDAKASSISRPATAGSEPLDVRMLLHAGELEIARRRAVGPGGREGASRRSTHLTPNTLFISEEFVKEGRGNVRLRDAGARGGLKLYTIVPPEPAPRDDARRSSRRRRRSSRPRQPRRRQAAAIMAKAKDAPARARDRRGRGRAAAPRDGRRRGDVDAPRHARGRAGRDDDRRRRSRRARPPRTRRACTSRRSSSTAPIPR